MPTPPKPRFGNGWEQTGRWRWRRRFLIGPVLEVEMEKMVFRPIVTGHTPANWVRITAWWRGDGGFEYPDGGQVEP